MYQFFQFMVQLLQTLIAFMNSYSFQIPTFAGTLTVSYLEVILGFILIGFVSYAFWKGAKT